MEDKIQNFMKSVIGTDKVATVADSNPNSMFDLLCATAILAAMEGNESKLFTKEQSNIKLNEEE